MTLFDTDIKLQQLILKYPDKSWNKNKFSKNPNITFDFVLYCINKYNEYIFNWDILSANLSINKEDIFTHSDLGWSNITLNPNISVEDIIDNSEKPWNWYEVSKYPNITMEFINKFPN